MKSFIGTIAILIFGFGGLLYFSRNETCRGPLAYDTGDIDEGFGMTRERFIDTIKDAENVWERGTGKELFYHRAGADFKINLIFDERQERTIEAGESKDRIEVSRQAYDSLVADYRRSSSLYETDLINYDSAVSSFDSDLRAYNEEIVRANRKGGATQEEYDRLEARRLALQERQTSINKQRELLNDRASQLNSLGERINAMARELNIVVDIHNETFGEAREFDQGEYTPGKINIYQFDSEDDLRLVLGHELGHALGIDHVKNPESLMYYLMDEQDVGDPSLSPEDIEAFNVRCNIMTVLRQIFSGEY